MKKTIAILISIFMAASFGACSNSENESVTEPVQTNAVEIIEEIPEDNIAEIDNAADTEAADSTETNSAEAETAPQVQESKILVAYFSATNTTEGVAERISNGLNADIYEIVPEEPYTSADLDYNDNNSRTTIEMNDPNSRPAISGTVENMGQYDIVFIGYPIWWGDAPRIVSTFMESYDFSGKTIIPFCTSGGSGMGPSASNLEALTSGADWLDGRRLNGGDSQDTVMEWVNGLGLDIK